jgi:alpha-ketoglutarate-dependent taurine dioxygenase
MARAGRFSGIHRTSVDIEDASLVTRTPGTDGAPTMVSASIAGLDLGHWLSAHRALLEDALTATGAVVLTGFAGAESEHALQASLDRAGRRTMRYVERSTPRRQVARDVYTSTEYPANQEIALHCELTAALEIPGHVWFICLERPGSGGETPVADTRAVLAGIPGDLAEEFRTKGWRLVRNYGTGFGPGWQEAMQSDSQAEVEEYFRKNAIEWQWMDGGRLRTEQIRNAIEVHPRTGEEVWFNHVVFWHDSALEPNVRAQMVRELGADGLPYQVSFGNGQAIPAEAIQVIQRAYRTALRERPWRDGDIMIVDNLLSAHGRRPFTGKRKIVVAMTDPTVRRPHPGGRPGNAP